MGIGSLHLVIHEDSEKYAINQYFYLFSSPNELIQKQSNRFGIRGQILKVICSIFYSVHSL